VQLFLPDFDAAGALAGRNRIFAEDPHWRGLTCFHEYFHADTGRGCGASHQTGWTGWTLALRHRPPRQGWGEAFLRAGTVEDQLPPDSMPANEFDRDEWEW
jgi:hypothetical protein